MPSSKKAIVTLLIGERYERMWDTHCRGNWQPYADRHGYDLIILRRRLDTSPRAEGRSLHWQKLLVFETPEIEGYDDVVWLDADIIVNYWAAPCIVEANPGDRVGAVRCRETFLPEMYEGGLKRFIASLTNEELRTNEPSDFMGRYERAGLGRDVDDAINTGVLAMKPCHQEFLRDVYDRCEENTFSGREEVPLSYSLLKADLVNGLDGRFNKMFDIEWLHHYPFFMFSGGKFSLKTWFFMVNSVFANSWFLHFTDGGARGLMRMVVTDHPFPESMRFLENSTFPEGQFSGKDIAPL